MGFLLAFLLAQVSWGQSNLWEQFSEVDGHIPVLEREMIGLSARSLLRAKILSVEEPQIDVEEGVLQFTLSLSGDQCRQNFTAVDERFLVYTICHREDYVLLEYISVFKREVKGIFI